MKLVNSNFENQIQFNENEVNVLVIENKQAFYNYVNILLKQINGSLSEGFILSNNDDILSLNKVAAIVTDYFNFNIQANKSFSNKLYSLLENIANEKYIENVFEINNNICNLLTKLDIEFNVNMSYEQELSIKKLLKAYNVSLNFSGDKLLEKIIDYIEVLQELEICNFLILVNIKDYLKGSELLSLYDYVLNKQFNLLLIENKFKKQIKYEKHLIIDEDLCEIIVDKNKI
jgi:CRISPR type II-A-associated protein Csn2